MSAFIADRVVTAHFLLIVIIALLAGSYALSWRWPRVIRAIRRGFRARRLSSGIRKPS